VGYTAGVPTYSTPNPIPTPAAATGQPTAQQPAGQQPVVQVNARVRNEVHPPDGYDGCKEGYESFRRHLVQYINYVDTSRKVNTALSFFNKGTADAWGRHYFTIHERKILGGTHTMEVFLEAADKYFRDPRLEERARQAILQTVPNRGETIKAFFIRFDELLVVAKMNVVEITLAPSSCPSTHTPRCHARLILLLNFLPCLLSFPLVTCRRHSS